MINEANILLKSRKFLFMLVFPSNMQTLHCNAHLIKSIWHADSDKECNYKDLDWLSLKVKSLKARKQCKQFTIF